MDNEYDQVRLRAYYGLPVASDGLSGWECRQAQAFQRMRKRTARRRWLHRLECAALVVTGLAVCWLIGAGAMRTEVRIDKVSLGTTRGALCELLAERHQGCHNCDVVTLVREELVALEKAVNQLLAERKSEAEP
jgi:hypothetical protein